MLFKPGDYSGAYDWLVVYDDLPASQGEALSLNSEVVTCRTDRSLLLTYEPSSIKYYGRDYVRQFGHVLTSHESSMLSHPRMQPMPPVGVVLWQTQDIPNLQICLLKSI